jgi:hypothetical protein
VEEKITFDKKIKFKPPLVGQAERVLQRNQKFRITADRVLHKIPMLS